MEGKTEEVERVAKKPHFRSGPEVDSANYHAARKARFERCGSVVAFAALLSRRTTTHRGKRDFNDAGA